MIEYALYKEFGILSMRLNFTEIYEEYKIEKDNQNRSILKIRGKEIGLVYYRNGY